MDVHSQPAGPTLPKLVLDRETIRHLTPTGFAIEARAKKSKKCPTPTPEPEPVPRSGGGGYGGMCTRVDNYPPCRAEKSRVDNPCTEEPGTPGTPGTPQTPGAIR